MDCTSDPFAAKYIISFCFIILQNAETFSSISRSCVPKRATDMLCALAAALQHSSILSVFWPAVVSHDCITAQKQFTVLLDYHKFVRIPACTPHARTHMCSPWWTHSLVVIHMLMHAHTRFHKRGHTQVHKRTSACAHARERTHPRTLALACTRTHPSGSLMAMHLLLVIPYPSRKGERKT